ncbi:MAG TPA: MFS transporter [Rhizomicrobium sp.]|nr:MFS transporter [Rhizomicrobium sp.]
MTVAADALPQSRAKVGAGIVTLLAVAVFVSYVDRGNVATAAPLMKDELRLSASEIGLLFSAFYWTYIPAQLLAGWLAGRINAYATLALGLGLWSLATAATGFAGGFAVLLALRLALGLGEGAIFPCSSKIIAQHIPERRLGAANGAIATGLALGPAFGTFCGGLFIARYGWRASFVLLGCMSLLWLVPWLNATRDVRAAERAAVQVPAPGFLAILKRREIWAASLGHFCGNYVFYFVIWWLPLYLVKARGFTLSQMAVIGGAMYLIYAANCQATGWLSDLWMQKGASANRVRKTFLVVAGFGATIAMMACAVGNATVCVGSLFAAGFFFGFATPHIYAVGQILAGPRAAGNWISVQNCLGNFSGILCPLVTGFVVDRTGSYFWAIALACAITLFGIVAWGVMIPKIAPLDWGEKPA